MIHMCPHGMAEALCWECPDDDRAPPLIPQGNGHEFVSNVHDQFGPRCWQLVATITNEIRICAEPEDSHLHVEGGPS